jgi:hypothetical protein
MIFLHRINLGKSTDKCALRQLEDTVKTWLKEPPTREIKTRTYISYLVPNV